MKHEITRPIKQLGIIRKEVYGIVVGAFLTVFLYISCLKSLEPYSIVRIFDYMKAMAVCCIGGGVLYCALKTLFLEEGQIEKGLYYLFLVSVLYAWIWERFASYEAGILLPVILIGLPAASSVVANYVSRKNAKGKWIQVSGIFCALFLWVCLGGISEYFDLWARILSQLWPLFSYLAMKLTNKIPGKGSISIWGKRAAYFGVIFLGMWFAAGCTFPSILNENYRWEIDKTIYFLVVADIIFGMGLHREQESGKIKGHLGSYSICIVSNALFLLFFICNHHRIRQILYSLGLDVAGKNLSYAKIDWIGLRMAAVRWNFTGSKAAGDILQKEGVYRFCEPWYLHPLTMMNVTAGKWLSCLFLFLFCFMVYLLFRLCRGSYYEKAGSCFCIAWLVRGILAFISNLFCIQSSMIRFPLMGWWNYTFGPVDMMTLAAFLCFYAKDRRTEI